MTEQYGDPVSAPFWEAAAEHRLLIQRCVDCGRHQFYPRPFCAGCASDAVEWVEAKGEGTVYSTVTVHVEITPELKPPYVVALVELDEGPRLTTNIVSGDAPIGSRVRLAWRDRENRPPLPVFEPVV